MALNMSIPVEVAPVRAVLVEVALVEVVVGDPLGVAPQSNRSINPFFWR